MGRRKTTEEFILEARSVHGDRYDYSISDYVGANTKICILCKQHGVFSQKPNHHRKGIGCSECSGNRKKTTEKFTIDAKAVHGDTYTYRNVLYTNNKNKVLITCKEHGDFPQTPDHHLKGVGCPMCSGNSKKNTESFIEEAKVIHSDRYTYENVIYTNIMEKVSMTCKEHGDFPQTPDHHLRGVGCPKCAEYGFNSSKPSVFYMYSFPPYVGFGISNDFETRDVAHQRNFRKYGIDATLIYAYSMLGEFARSLETHIKRSKLVINSGVEGFKTEAVHADNTEKVITNIKNYLTTNNVEYTML